MIKTLLNSPQKAGGSDQAKQEEFLNLVKQLPSEATGIYLAGMSTFANDTLWLTIAAAVGLVVLIWIRKRANVSKTIWLTSIIGYIIWVYVIGNGPLQAAAEMIHVPLHPGLGAFLVAVYSIGIGVLTFKPPGGG